MVGAGDWGDNDEPGVRLHTKRSHHFAVAEPGQICGFYGLCAKNSRHVSVIRQGLADLTPRQWNHLGPG